MKHYFEFREHDYYALVAVTVDDQDLYTKPYKKAAELYVDVVAGESVEEVIKEADLHLVSEEFAFMKFVRAEGHGDMTLKEVISQFDECSHGALLIDNSLLK